MLKDIDRRLQDVEDASKEISRKLDDLRGGRGSAYTPPQNFTEPAEST
jgi:hypothetical protein